MKSITLEAGGCRSLTAAETDAVWGGSIPPLVWTILSSLVSHFGDFREGISDGYNYRAPRY